MKLKIYSKFYQEVLRFLDKPKTIVLVRHKSFMLCFSPNDFVFIKFFYASQLWTSLNVIATFFSTNFSYAIIQGYAYDYNSAFFYMLSTKLDLWCLALLGIVKLWPTRFFVDHFSKHSTIFCFEPGARQNGGTGRFLSCFYI